MFTRAITSSSMEQSDLVTYRKNAEEILQRIENQFIRAVKAVNDHALQNGSPYTIFFTVNLVHRKLGIPVGEEFRELNTFDITITKGDVVDYKAPVFRCKREDIILFLGEITPFLGTSDALKRMAQGKSQDISNFEEIFNYWFEELKNEINFSQQNALKIITTKEKINSQFIRAIKEINTYVQDNALKPVIINDTNYAFNQKLPEKNKFEPLKKYNLNMLERSNSIQYTPIIGTITLIENREQFRAIINQEPQDFEELFQRCLADMTRMVDRANLPFLSKYCTLL